MVGYLSASQMYLNIPVSRLLFVSANCKDVERYVNDDAGIWTEYLV